MKKIIILIFALVLVLSLSACSSSETPVDTEDSDSSIEATEEIDESETTETEGSKLANPFIECDNMDKAEMVAGFRLDVVDIPDGYTQTYQAIENEMVQITLTKEDQEIILRKGIGDEDISGDYNVYPEEGILMYDGMEILFKGQDGLINLATWTDGEYSYAIVVSGEGIDEGTLALFVVGMN